jgi:hypothetical protein
LRSAASGHRRRGPPRRPNGSVVTSVVCVSINSWTPIRHSLTVGHASSSTLFRQLQMRRPDVHLTDASSLQQVAVAHRQLPVQTQSRDSAIYAQPHVNTTRAQPIFSAQGDFYPRPTLSVACTPSDLSLSS